MPSYAVILPAAGKSTRFADPWRKKVFVDLKGRPVWLRSVEAFHGRADIAQTILAISPEDMPWFREKFAANLAFMNLEVVAGGESRTASVQNALARVRPDIEYIAVHDAARPLVTAGNISAVFEAAATSGAAILATPVASTVKRTCQQAIVETVDRTDLWAAQTPQVFARSLLLEAYAKRGDFAATDEAQLVERLGRKVTIVPGSQFNLKITTQEDFAIASALLDVLPRDKALASLQPTTDKKPGLW